MSAFVTQNVFGDALARDSALHPSTICTKFSKPISFSTTLQEIHVKEDIEKHVWNLTAIEGFGTDDRQANYPVIDDGYKEKIETDHQMMIKQEQTK